MLLSVHQLYESKLLWEVKILRSDSNPSLRRDGREGAGSVCLTGGSFKTSLMPEDPRTKAIFQGIPNNIKFKIEEKDSLET